MPTTLIIIGVLAVVQIILLIIFLRFLDVHLGLDKMYDL
jgi:hypothetical protein